MQPSVASCPFLFQSQLLKKYGSRKKIAGVESIVLIAIIWKMGSLDRLAGRMILSLRPMNKCISPPSLVGLNIAVLAFAIFG